MHGRRSNLPMLRSGLPFNVPRRSLRSPIIKSQSYDYLYNLASPSSSLDTTTEISSFDTSQTDTSSPPPLTPATPLFVSSTGTLPWDISPSSEPSSPLSTFTQLALTSNMSASTTLPFAPASSHTFTAAHTESAPTASSSTSTTTTSESSVSETRRLPIAYSLSDLSVFAGTNSSVYPNTASGTQSGTRSSLSPSMPTRGVLFDDIKQDEHDTFLGFPDIPTSLPSHRTPYPTRHILSSGYSSHTSPTLRRTSGYLEPVTPIMSRRAATSSTIPTVAPQTSTANQTSANGIQDTMKPTAFDAYGNMGPYSSNPQVRFASSPTSIPSVTPSQATPIVDVEQPTPGKPIVWPGSSLFTDSPIVPVDTTPQLSDATFFRWILSLPSYNGVGQPGTFIDRFIMLTAGKSDYDKVLALKYKLTDHAASWLARLPAHQAATSTGILTQLMQQFQDSKAVRMDQLEDLEFRAVDNLPAYIRKYAQLAYSIPNTTGEDQAHRFIGSLNPELRKQIRLAYPSLHELSTLQGAFQAARHVASVLGYDISDDPIKPQTAVPNRSTAAKVHHIDSNGAVTYFTGDEWYAAQALAVQASPPPAGNGGPPPGTSVGTNVPPTVVDAAAAVYTSIKATNAKLGAFGSQLTNVESKIDVINNKVTTLDTRVTNTETKIKAHDQQLTSLAPMLASLKRIEANVTSTSNSQSGAPIKPFVPGTVRPGPKRFDTACPDCGGVSYSHTADQCFVTHPEVYAAYQRRMQSKTTAKGNGQNHKD
jgi:hypothetical protein